MNRISFSSSVSARGWGEKGGERAGGGGGGVVFSQVTRGRVRVGV